MKGQSTVSFYFHLTVKLKQSNTLTILMLYLDAMQLHKMQKKRVGLNTGANIVTILRQKSELGTTHWWRLLSRA